MSDQPGAGDLYRATADDPAAARLLGMIERIDDRIASLDAQQDDEGGDPDADLQAILTGLCRPDDAPLEWRSIGGRVERGTLTWQHFWAHPREEGPAGTALVAAALDASSTGILQRLRAQEPMLLEQIDREDPESRGGAAGGRGPTPPTPGGAAHR